MEKICKLCGEKFIPKTSRQAYCKKEVEKICPVCGDTFKTICSPNIPTTCSKPECKKKAGYVGSIAKKKICKICGSEFIGTSTTQEYCNKPVVRICSVCGKEFTIKCTAEEYKKQTCSVECMNKLASDNRQIVHMQKTKICEWCGKEFHPRSNTQRFCDEPHYQTCVVCGKRFKLEYKGTLGETLTDVRKTCSKECERENASRNCAFRREDVQQKIKETMKMRYGVEHPSQNKEIQAKQQATTMANHGVAFYPQHPDYAKKAVSTNQKKYGTNWAIQNKDIQKKREETNLERFGNIQPMAVEKIKEKFRSNYRSKTGYDNPLKNPEVREKIKQHFLSKHGVECYSQTDEYKLKYQTTCLEKFGVSNPNQNEYIKAKTRKTCLEKYGSECFLSSEKGKKISSERMKKFYGKSRYSQTADWKEQIMSRCDNMEEWMAFVEDPETYIVTHFGETKPTYRKLADHFGVNISSVGDIIYRKGLRHMIKMSLSYMEEEIIEFLEELGLPSSSIVRHNRQVINPLELDVTIPELKFAIECNPTSTHNSSLPYKNIESISVTPTTYHQNKTNLCEKEGWFVFHLFGYEWIHKKNIIKSMICNLVKKNKNCIYARKCDVKEVSWKDSLQFLEDNHRQGSASSKIRLGLYYEDQLVSLMTFGRMRTSMVSDNEDLSECWELIRFCNLTDTSVVGAASKLFQHFIREYHPVTVRSFSDRARAKGNLYATLGFTEIRRSEPGYVWVNTRTDMAYHRMNAQKQNIRKFLKDDSIDLSKSEREIMIEHGFVQVFDSGTILWEWKKGDTTC